MLKLHQIISYGLMVTGAVASARAMLRRQQWEEVNVHAGIMLDWDDVQAVATRALTVPGAGDVGQDQVVDLLVRFKENGATHLSMPELTLNRLLEKGELNVIQGPSTDRIYLQARNITLANLVVTELQARLPQIRAIAGDTDPAIISFIGDLPSVAEIGLGFDPAHAALAHQVGLSLVARPIGYSWVQPEMIERTLDQAATLGARIVAVQGNLIPGHEFKMQSTVEAMQRNGLTYAYFKESRHQKGDWFLAKHLAPAGLVILAHEFQPVELLEEDWFTAAYRWANLAVEAGVRLCCVRFFRILHAADPLESLAYVKELAHALNHAGLLPAHAGQVDLTVYQPERDEVALACAGLSIAGAAGLAADLLPGPDHLKLAGIGAGALALAGLPFWEKARARESHHRHHHHDHDHDHHHHAHHGHDHDHDHGHHHDHDHDHHDHPPRYTTAYAPKGLALAATVAYPAATIALNGFDPVRAIAHALAISTTGAAALNATTAESDYLMGIEEYRGYNLDWLIPISLITYTSLLNIQNVTKNTFPKSKIQNPAKGTPPEARKRAKSKIWNWLPLAGLAWAALKSLNGQLAQDLPAKFDREHRHAHTHHLSAFQRTLGDSKMALSPRPLRKWTLLAPLGAVGAVLLRQNGQPELASAALATAAVGQVAMLTGFRNGQRPLSQTLAGRAKGWMIGGLIAGAIWLIFSLFNKKYS